MPQLRSTLVSSILLGASIGVGAACTEVTIAPGVTTSGDPGGSGGQGGMGTTTSTGGAGGGMGGTGGGIPVDMPWQATIEGDISQVAVATDPAGNAIVAGVFNGTLDLGGGPLTSAQWGSAFVLKLDPAGHHLWSRSIANAGHGPGLAVDGLGNILLTGGFRESLDVGGGPLPSAGNVDVYVAKLSPDGNPIYSRVFGDTAFQNGVSIAADAAGNAYVSGAFLGTVDFGGGPLESFDVRTVFVTALDPAGHHVWSRRFGGDGQQDAGRIAVGPGGALAITGTYEGAPDFGGGPLPDFQSNILAHTFLLRLDAAGNHVESTGYNCHHTTPTFDAAGNVALVGAFTGDVDFGGGVLTSGYFVHVAAAKFGATQSLLWDEAFGEVGATVYGIGSASFGDGSTLIAGYATGAFDFGGGKLLGGEEHKGGFLTRLDASGGHVWSRAFTGEGDLLETSVAATPTGSVVLAGTFTGTIDFAEGPATSVGKRDLFVVKLVH
ncbi:Hypothetical protein A7982_07398 [Minicystis rosea]|nr:Hypothetical protein A7982_07398 [Minicystis rosea]